jgi:hypothetical protein
LTSAATTETATSETSASFGPLNQIDAGLLLAQRRDRWPNTANPHLINTQQSAYGVAPIASSRLAEEHLGWAGGPDRLRRDR